MSAELCIIIGVLSVVDQRANPGPPQINNTRFRLMSTIYFPPTNVFKQVGIKLQILAHQTSAQQGKAIPIYVQAERLQNISFRHFYQNKP